MIGGEGEEGQEGEEAQEAQEAREAREGQEGQEEQEAQEAQEGREGREARDRRRVRARISARLLQDLTGMPYSVSWPDNTFLADFAGVVTSDEIEAVNHAFSGDARMDTVRYSVWDFSRTTSIAMPDHEVVYAVAFDKGVTAVRRSLRGALIASREEVRQCLLQYLQLAEQAGIEWDTRLFEDFAAARRWLEHHG